MQRLSFPKPGELYLPVTFGLIGTLCAICWSMVHLQSEFSVTFDKSVPVAMLGGVGGAIVGALIQFVVRRLPKITRVVFVIEVVLISVSVCAPIGWIVRNPYEDPSGQESIWHGAVVGLVVCAVMFAVACLIQFRRRS